MNYLTIPFLKLLLNKREAKLALSFSLFPTLLIIVDLFSTNFMKLSAPDGSLSFLEFLSAVLLTQYQTGLPLIAFVYLSGSLFREEIGSGILYLYKDISKQVILNAKWSAMFIFQILYLSLTFVTSIFTYYSYLVHKTYTSGFFFPNRLEDTKYAVISIVGTTLIFFTCLMVANLASVVLTSGFIMLVGIMFALISFIAPSLTFLRYLFPNGYVNIFNSLGFNLSLLIQITLSILYFLILYCSASYLFKRVEY